VWNFAAGMVKICKPGWVQHGQEKNGKPRPIFSIDVHPDGKRFVTAGGGSCATSPTRSLHHPPRSRLRSPLTRARAAPVRAPDNTIKIWSMAPLLSESADADPAVDKVRRTPRWLVPPNRAAAAAATVATCPDRS
jgi:hypothetical protein